MNFILLLKSEASDTEKAIVDAWCKSEFDKILASFTSANAQDIPTILTVIRVVGLSSFETLSTVALFILLSLNSLMFRDLD